MRRIHLALSALSLATTVLLPGAARGQSTAAGGQGTTPAPRTTGQAAAQPACRVEGTWDLVSVTVDGKPMPLGGHQQRKVVGGGRFMWLGQAARRDTLPMRTALDTLRATSIAGGAGTFTLAGDTYTERLEYFSDPSLLGQSLRATCRTEGDRWHHAFMVPWGAASSTTPRQRVEEVWRRLP